MRYPVTSIFYSLQGEGHFVGYPMAFVRLAGCSVVGCHIRKECDESPWKAKETLDETAILAEVQKFQCQTVCITGGEPTDHDLIPLVTALQAGGYRIHLETSGVRAVTGLPIEWLTVSPKITGLPLAQRVGHTLKVVVRPEWRAQAWTIVEQWGEKTNFFHRYLQPLTVGGEAVNLAEVAKMVLSAENVGGWALSTQAHRGWNLA